MRLASRSPAGIVILLAFVAVAASCGVAPASTTSTTPTVEPSIATRSASPPTGEVVPAWWWVDGETLPLTAEATVIRGFLRERSCASGASPLDRALAPTIEYRPDAVVVVFAVVALAGEQDCTGNPAFPVEVRLTEPLGSRSVLDGSEDPPRDATTLPA